MRGELGGVCLLALLVLRHATPKYISRIHWILPSCALVAGITFDGINSFAIAFFNNANMITDTVTAPVKEDNVAGICFIPPFLPLMFILKPLNACGTIVGL